MKLTKASLLKNVRKGLIELEYKEVKDSVSGTQGLFIKRISPDFFLSLGFTISRFYDSKFTADFYLSKTTRWSSLWGDIPRESYKRVGDFLTKAERQEYLDGDNDYEEGTDTWWQGDQSSQFQNFLSVVKIEEGRFLQQEVLFDKVENSNEVKEMVANIAKVSEIMDKGIDENFEYHYLPAKAIDEIPVVWFKAAEQALKANGSILNSNTVKILASDAWRQKNI